MLCAATIFAFGCSAGTNGNSGGRGGVTTGSGGTRVSTSSAAGGTSLGGAAATGGTVSSAGGGGAMAGAPGTATGGAAGGSTAGATSGSGGRSSDGGTDLRGKNNPVLAGYTADPHVVLFDDTFYIYPTTDGFNDWGSTSFSVFSSTNLVQWTSRGVILNIPKDLTWATGHGWAPTIARVGSTYFFYFSADSQIGVATSSSPTGPFKDALGKPLVTGYQYGLQSIDPYVFIDDDGTAYLYFGSGGGLRVAKLKADMVSFASAPTNVSLTGASGTLEGSAMFKRKGSYYLAWSEGDTRLASYAMAYARAQSPLGPFARAGVIVAPDTSQGILGAGGGTVLAIANRDAYYLAYHRFKIPGGDGTHREICIDRLSFNPDGTIVSVKPTLDGLQEGVQP